MPRKKGVPSRRVVLPLADEGEVDVQSCDSDHENQKLLRKDPHLREDELELEPEPGPRPIKRRRKTPAVEPYEANVTILKAHEIAGLLQLTSILIAVDGESVNPPAAVNVNLRDNGDEAIPVSVEFRVAGVPTTCLSAPDLSTARNFVRLLQDGVLGLAIRSACRWDATNCDWPCAMYDWDSDLTPTRLPQETTSTTALLGTTTGPNAGQPDAAGDWAPAVYRARSSPGNTCARGCCLMAYNLGTHGEGSTHTPTITATTTATTASSQAAQAGAGTARHAGKAVSLRFGICAPALARLSSNDPEDTQQHAWQGRLLHVLGWLLPHTTLLGSAAAGKLPLSHNQHQHQPTPLLEEAVDPSARPSVLDSGTAGPSQQSLASPSSTAPSRPHTMSSPGPSTSMGAPGFDPGWLYGAVKPSGGEPQWMDDPLELRPRLRPYQRRSVAWMLRREQASREEAEAGGSNGTALHPLWRRIHTLPGSAAASIYINAYTGALASEPFPAPGPVRGGILADEMGLGKTVELLALITARRFRAVQQPSQPQPQPQPQLQSSGKRAEAGTSSRPQERVHCPCGVKADDPDDPDLEEYGGLWILCDGCNAWMHGSCVGVKKAPRSAWVCTRCLRDRALATVSEPCGASLIVVPSAILQQWFDEVRRHVHPGALRVVVYGGQAQSGVCNSGLPCGTFSPSGVGVGGGGKDGTGTARGGGVAVQGGGGGDGDESDVVGSMVVSAADLAAADVVLTTYDVLKRDLARQPDLQVPERSLRHGKRYEVVPTPLTRLRWWRVVLDEAQMVESSTAKATEMALKLDTVHRWCVTGTPISRGLEDLYGLMAFLGPRPWSERRWWNLCVQRPVEAGDAEGRRLLLQLLRPCASASSARSGGLRSGYCGGGLMWRSSKRDVEAELGLPAQSTHISHLRLNAVELHFYNRQHQDCAAKARAVLPPRVVAAMESGRLLMGVGAGQPGEGDAAQQAAEEEQRPGEDGERRNLRGASSAIADERAAALASGSGAEPLEIGAADEAEAVEAEMGDEDPGREKTVRQAMSETERHETPLAELREIQRRRWESWRQRQHEELLEERWHKEPLAGEDAAAASSIVAANCIAVVMPSTSADGPDDRSMAMMASGGHIRAADEGGGDREGCAAPQRSRRRRRSGGGGGGSPPRLEGPRQALAASASSLDRPLAPHEARKLLGPLLKLRQACCHPQVGAGGIRTLTAAGQLHHRHHAAGSHHSAPMTMNDILAVLVTRAKVEAEEAQRQLIAALNGLSALMIIQGDVEKAITTYREALRVMENNKPDIGTDPLQRLHTLHNLDQVLASMPATAAASVPRTLRDHTLGEDVAAIRSRYLEQWRQKLAAAEVEYKELISASSPFHGAAGWYLAAIDLLETEGYGQVAVEHIKEKLLEGDTYRQKTEVNASSLANRFSSLLGLKVILNDILEAIEQHRAEAMRTLDDLGARAAQTQPAPELVEQAGQCGRCRTTPLRTALVCEHCRLDELFIQWEVRLFALYSRALTAGAKVTAEEAARRAQAAMVRFAGRGGLNEQQGDMDLRDDGGDESRRGANVAVANTSWRQSEAEMVLRLLLALLRQHFKRRVDARLENITREGKAHVDRLEAQRRLLVAARATSLNQRMLLYAHDELAMATTRMRLATEDEHIAAHEGNLKLHPAAVPIKNVELTNDRIVAENDLIRRLGTLRYLRKLQSIQKQQQERRQKEQQQERQQQQQQQQGEETEAVAQAAAAVVAVAAANGGDQGVSTGTAHETTPVAHNSSPKAEAVGPPRSQAAGEVPTSEALVHSGMQAASSNPNAAAPAAQAITTTTPTLAPTNLAAPGANAAACGSEAADGGDSKAGGGGESGSSETEAEFCPICHDPLDTSLECVILPCGHQMHPVCCDALITKMVAPSTPHHQKRVNCPTCRTRVHVADIAYIDAGLTHGSEGANGGADGDNGDGGPWAGEMSVMVRGSFGTKIESVVRRVKFLMEQDASAKVLVFSGWADLLELVAAALAANAVPYVLARGRGGMAAALAAFKDHPGELDSQLEDEEGEGDGEENCLDEQKDINHDTTVIRTLRATGTSGGSGPTVIDDGEDGMAHPPGLSEVGKKDQEEQGWKTPPPQTQPSPAPSRQQQQQQQGHPVAGCSAEPAATKPPTLSTAAVMKPSPVGPGNKESATLTPARGSVHPHPPLTSPAKQVQIKPRVLLLQLKQGGAGLNLTEAQHVVLVEPQLDPAAEAQAVGRVHRIGQSRPTHVHRFLVSHTVEEQVHKLAAARACGMDLAVAVPRGRSSHGVGHSGRGGGAGDGSEYLTVRDVAILLDTRWEVPPASANTAASSGQQGG